MSSFLHNTKIANKITIVIIGSFLFCLGMNLFITPLGLYSGGIIGIAQILRTFLADAGIVFDFEISGIINMIFNVPLLFLAYRSISKRFFLLTLISIAMQTIFFSIIPIPHQIIDDVLASCIVGGLVSGYGIGLVLRSSGSSGGVDIIGFYIIQKAHDFGVGKLSTIINCVIFAFCMFFFDIDTAIYSMLFTVVFGFVVDKIHYQNINVTAMIFTKYPDIRKPIMEDLHRGVTYWRGHGAYTEKDTYILVTAVSKYEVNYLRNEVKRIDPDAFIIFSESMNISGNFEKHL